ncbi:MAG: apolipoprotein N-acyltransferase [Rhodopila sp.]
MSIGAVVTRWAGRFAALTGWRADIALTVAGALSALALPPVHFIPVLLLTIPALLAQIGTARGFRGAAGRGWWFGLGFYIAGLYWVTDAILFEADRFWWVVPLAVPALAALLAAFLAPACAIARLAPPGWQRVLTLAGGWTLSDLARQFVLSGFPWNPLGSVWELPGAAGDVLIQPASLAGVHGLTFAAVLLAGLPMLGWRWRGAGAAVLALWIGLGFVRLNQSVGPAQGLTVVLVQGNVAQGEKWDRAVMVAIFRHYLEMTRDAVARVTGPAVVVWPETASPALLETDAPARALIAQAAGNHPSLIGAIRFDAKERPRNSLFALGPDGAIQAIYDKWHLVPFGEYQPGWWPESFEVFPGGGFCSGDGPHTLMLPGLPPVGPLICYEAIFSHQVLDEANRPAWMVNVTNDAWFGNSSGPRQHLAAGRLRAVEEGLPLVRAANTGISAAFDAFGQEIARLGLNQTGVLFVALPPPVAPPLFARFGLVIPLCLGIVAVVTGLSRRRPL